MRIPFSWKVVLREIFSKFQQTVALDSRLMNVECFIITKSIILALLTLALRNPLPYYHHHFVSFLFVSNTYHGPFIYVVWQPLAEKGLKYFRCFYKQHYIHFCLSRLNGMVSVMRGLFLISFLQVFSPHTFFRMGVSVRWL